jgi:iron uptake system component EfeO
MPALRPAAVPLLSLAVLSAALVGCAQKDTAASSSSASSDAVAVEASDTACELSATEVPAGAVHLAVHNAGSKVTEVYVYGAGDRIVAERENIGPGTRASITAQIKAGTYEVACKPGMKGDGIRQKITVSGGGASAAAADPRLDSAVAAYRAYVQEQADQALPVVRRFAEAVRAGDTVKAKELFAASRIGWERTEPVAESFGDIDPLVDAREDSVEAGQKWTGWHRLEKSLWQGGKIGTQEKDLAGQLVTELSEWQERVGTADITASSMANGAKELLDEVATGKVTGEEDRYSHTDLSDFNANVEGARKAYELLRPVAVEKDAALAATLDSSFDSLQQLLAKYRKGDGFVSYDTVGSQERKAFSDAVNALAEPLSKLAAVVVR